MVLVEGTSGWSVRLCCKKALFLYKPRFAVFLDTKEEGGVVRRMILRRIPSHEVVE